MVRVAEILLILAAAAAAGGPAMVVMLVPGLEAWQISCVFLAGCVVATPIAYLLAGKIYAVTGSRVGLGSDVSRGLR